MSENPNKYSAFIIGCMRYKASSSDDLFSGNSQISVKIITNSDEDNTAKTDSTQSNDKTIQALLNDKPIGFIDHKTTAKIFSRIENKTPYEITVEKRRPTSISISINFQPEEIEETEISTPESSINEHDPKDPVTSFTNSKGTRTISGTTIHVLAKQPKTQAKSKGIGPTLLILIFLLICGGAYLKIKNSNGSGKYNTSGTSNHTTPKTSAPPAQSSKVKSKSNAELQEHDPTVEVEFWSNTQTLKEKALSASIDRENRASFASQEISTKANLIPETNVTSSSNEISVNTKMESSRIQSTPNFRLLKIKNQRIINRKYIQIEYITNWSNDLPEPFIAVADRPSHEQQGIFYDEEVVTALTLNFDRNASTLIMEATKRLRPGEHKLLLEFIIGEEVVYQPIWFELSN